MTISHGVSGKLTELREHIESRRSLSFQRFNGALEHIQSHGMNLNLPEPLEGVEAFIPQNPIHNLAEDAKNAALNVAKLVAGGYKFATVKGTSFAYSPAKPLVNSELVHDS